MSLPPPEDNYAGEPRYPSPWASTRPLEGLRDTDEARIISLAPDVCLTPMGATMVPVPYPVVDYCGHDQNYTETVRFTGQKAMVLRSSTTHVHGDAPGTGKGVKSGTVEGISEPIGHAAQLRAEGSPVIRHLDRCWMNNRNTVGEALFVCDTKTHPAPQDDDPFPGSLRRSAGPAQDTTAGSTDPAMAEWSSLQSTPASGATGALRGGAPLRLAFAGDPAEFLGQQPPSSPAPTTEAPPSRPAPVPPRQGPGGGRLLRRGIFGYLLQDMLRSASQSPEEQEAEALAMRVILSPRAESIIAQQRLLGGRTPMTIENLGNGSAFDFSGRYGVIIDPEDRVPLANDILSTLAGRRVDVRTSTRAQVETILAEAERSPQPIPQGEGARVSRRNRDCPIGPHSLMQPVCASMGQQAHHVVPDRSFRSAGPGSVRMQGAPSYGEGLAVCVESNRAGPDSEHSLIHNEYYDKTAEAEAINGSHPGLITLGRAEDLGSQALEAGTNGRCPREYIRAALRSYHQGSFGLEPDALVRGQKGPLDPGAAAGLGGQSGGRDAR